MERGLPKGRSGEMFLGLKPPSFSEIIGRQRGVGVGRGVVCRFP